MLIMMGNNAHNVGYNE